MEFLSYGKQWIEKTEQEAVLEVLKSDFLTQGPKVEDFEKAICEYTKAKYCVVVSNGTAALHLAIKALGIEKGKKAITSPNTFVASANAALYNDLLIDFVDINANTYNLDPLLIEKKIDTNVKLIIPVHFAGQPALMPKIKQLAEKYNLYIIEDAAHAIGSNYANGEKVGSCCYSELTTFSFHPVKTITTAEGGAITTNSKKLYEKLLLLRSHGITKNPSFLFSSSPGPWYYEMQELGFNYRMSDLQAALGVCQLKKLNFFIKRRKEIVNRYNQAFKKVDWLKIPFEETGLKSAFHLYVLLFDFQKLGIDKVEVMQKLKDQNIGTQVHYIPVHTQPYYQKSFGFKQGDFPVCEAYYKNALSIPLYPKMTDSDVDYVIEKIKGLDL